MNLYPKNQEPFQDALFGNPSSEYRGAPFYSWNCRITPELNTKIVEALKEMGMGGGHIHCRTGLENPYLGEDFMAMVKDANEKFTGQGMLTWLYDEDRWPSGYGGGFVTVEKKYRARFLVFSPRALDGTVEEQNYSSSGEAVRSDDVTLLARYQIRLEEGWLQDYRRLTEGEIPEEGYEEWFAYLEVSGDTPWFNNQSYVNTLDREAMNRFIEVTHEAYKKQIGQEFGKSIPAIFTDEPQFSHKGRLYYATDKMQVIIPYTDDLEETFRESYGYSLLGALPELFWEKKEEMVSPVRYAYHDHICERFVSAFTDNIGGWCEKNGLMLTGHMMAESTLRSQTIALGEAMRAYRSFQLPGIDMLCDYRELSTAKQAQSAAHQYGRPGVLSELYGVTNWDFDFRGHKLQGDWQAALGVTVRVHHLTWASMLGEAKRDYPACIGYQSPWYREYAYVEDYFARINTLLTRGKADVRIGVIHPIESCWLYWGSEEKTGGICEEMDHNFDSLIKWLLFGMQDFDFICESLLPELQHMEEVAGAVPADLCLATAAAADGSSLRGFQVGEMSYQTVLVPNCVTLRRSTYERLKKWRNRGGKVIFAGEIPSYLDAVPTEEVEEFAQTCIRVPFTRNSLLDALEENRTVEVRNQAGMRTGNLIYQLRQEGEHRILFLAHVYKMDNPDLPHGEDVTISIEGTWQVTRYEPLEGTREKLQATQKGGRTVLKRKLYDHDSLLLYLTPGQDTEEVQQESSPGEQPRAEVGRGEEWTELPVEHLVPVTLSEPNVLVLDMAQYRFDNGEWMPREELLRIDNQFRKRLGYPQRMEALAQPWLEQIREIPEHILTLRFQIQAQLDVEDTLLALENREARIWLNGQEIDVEEKGWYVDQGIRCRKLGRIQKGQNELIVEIPYCRKENIENFFLLGDFGVRVRGSESVITEPVRQLAFGDQTVQGLAFYGGNVEYRIPIRVPEDGILRVEASRFRNPLLKVSLDEGEERVIAYSPYQAELACPAGEHVLHLKAFGNRFNTFGTLHNCNETEDWFGPNAWRSEGAAWSYEYQLRKTGILKAPVIRFQKQDGEKGKREWNN